VQYYPVFAALLLVVAAAARLSTVRRGRAAGPGLAAAAVIVVLFLANLAPNLADRAAHGENPSVGHRTLLETMAFSLRLTDLLLPIRDHRVAALGHRVQDATEQLGGPMEGGSPALGAIAGVGFVVLVLALAPLALRRRTADDDPPSAPTELRLSHLAVPAVAAFVIATTGGGAAILAFWAGSPLRAWNRLSIFIAFFALAAIGLLVERGVGRLSPAIRRPALPVVLVALVLVGGLDQTSPAFAVDRTSVPASWRNDERFVAAVEARLGRSASVLQLPYLSFPENGQFRGMIDYEPLRGYLHADDLAFSYGAVRDRPADWQEGLVGLPAPVVATAAALIGFDGIWVDGRGYPGTADALVSSLAASAATSDPMTSEDGAFTVVDLRPLRHRLASTPDRAALRRRLLRPIAIGYGNGFVPREQDDRHLWNWTVGRAVLHLDAAAPRDVIVRTTVSTIGDVPATAVATAGTTPLTFSVGAGGTTVEVPVHVPAGGIDVVWDSDVVPARSPDGRTLALRLTDLSVVDADVRALADEVAGPVVGNEPVV
jgi:phosphoglycerol transferase